MKKQIKKIVLLIVAIFGVNCVNAQKDFSYHLGILFPQGKFADSRDDGNVAWGYETDRAGAGFGFNFGMKLRFEYPSIKGLGIIATADFFYNTPNDDIQDWKDDIEESWDADEFSLKAPKYINIPIMVGLNYEYEINDNTKFFGEGALGFNIGTLTDFSLYASGTEEYSYADYNWTERKEYSYKTNLSFAFQFGAGFMFNNKYSLGVHYYLLGSQKIKGEYLIRSTYDVLSDKDEGRFTFKSINPSILAIRFGYHF